MLNMSFLLCSLSVYIALITISACLPSSSSLFEREESTSERNNRRSVESPAAVAAAIATTTTIKLWKLDDNRSVIDNLAYDSLLAVESTTITSQTFDNTKNPKNRRRHSTSTTPTAATAAVSTRTNSKRLVPSKVEEKKCLRKTNSVLCNEADNYPWKEVKAITLSRKLTLDFFGNDSLSFPDSPTNKAHEDFDQPFCKSMEYILFPKIGLNKNQAYRYILQGDREQYRQGIRVEACAEDTECMFMETSLSSDKEAKCVQKYINRKLIAIEPESGADYMDEFPIPACCVCQYRFRENLGDDD